MSLILYMHCAHRIAEREREWEMKLKEALAAKEQRIRTVQCEREKMIAEVSMQFGYSLPV